MSPGRDFETSRQETQTQAPAQPSLALLNGPYSLPLATTNTGRVTDFQQSRGLTVDGIVGSKTLKALVDGS
ncbi:MAG: peptidoglycan-binding protein [Chloroflexi bacterium]|nr:peptidoglycan-binding protein [Chloroflexota bacterium]MBU1750300.1 peptidoglycan-binding protein [Chloroflexota bacterium]